MACRSPDHLRSARAADERRIAMRATGRRSPLRRVSDRAGRVDHGDRPDAAQPGPGGREGRGPFRVARRGAVPDPRLWIASCRSEASPAANDSRMHSDMISARSAARASAAASVCVRQYQRSRDRITTMIRRIAIVTPAIEDLRTPAPLVSPRSAAGLPADRPCRRRTWRTAAGCDEGMPSRSRTAAEVAQQIGHGHAAGFVEEPSRGQRARRIGKLRLVARESGEAGLKHRQWHPRTASHPLVGPRQVSRFECGREPFVQPRWHLASCIVSGPERA